MARNAWRSSIIGAQHNRFGFSCVIETTEGNGDLKLRHAARRSCRGTNTIDHRLSTTARDQSIHVTSPTAIRFRRFCYTLLGRFRRIKQPIRIGILRRDDRDFNFHGYVTVHIQNS